MYRFLLGSGVRRTVAVAAALRCTTLWGSIICHLRLRAGGIEAVMQPRPELRGVQKREPGVHDLEEDLHEVECKSGCDALVP